MCEAVVSDRVSLNSVPFDDNWQSKQMERNYSTGHVGTLMTCLGTSQAKAVPTSPTVRIAAALSFVEPAVNAFDGCRPA